MLRLGRNGMGWLQAILLIEFITGPVALGEDPKHPFMLWTKQEAASIRKLIETEPWAKEAYAREDWPLLRYGIMGDKAAGEAEKALLLKDLAAGKVVSGGNAHRYDVLYDLLTPDEREKIKQAFITAVDAGIARMAMQRGYTRWNWLPNLGYAWYSRLHEIAAATGDEKVIRRMFEAPNAFKWYMDEYLSDLGFYNEEFSKMFNTPQGLAHWCWAMERLGLDELGWGYKGRQGASMRGHIDSILRIGYPRVDLCNGRFFYPRLTIGDTRGGGYAGVYGLQHSLILKADGPARGDWYVELLHMAHAKWPDAGYGYFLAQIRETGQSAYALPLRFGVRPIEADKVRPPPAPSGVYPGRGLVMLRAEEGPEYWESNAPAIGMRLATPYAHHVQDSFCLTGFYALGRPIFANHAHATNYTGVDPGYSNSSRSHSVVLVDKAEPNSLLEPAQTRHDFNPRVKFVAARAKGIFKGVDQTRSLMLTREYLLDVSHLVSDRTRDYLWQIHTFGHACLDRPAEWTPSTDLAAWLPDLAYEQSCATQAEWSVTATQATGGPNPQFATVGPKWFERRIGVKITMLGEANTRAYTAWAPIVSDTSGQWRGRSRFAFGEEEPAGVAVVANRKAARTTFIAVHEPFEKVHRIAAVRRIAQDEHGFVIAVESEAFTDYLLLALGDKAAEAVMMGTPAERFCFENYGYVRFTPQRVDVEGDVRNVAIPVGQARPKLFVKGQAADARFEGGQLIIGFPESAGKTAEKPPVTKPVGPIAARWQPPTGLCLPTKGKGATTLRLRNAGLAPITADVAIVAPKGLVTTPASVPIKDFAPGGEMNVNITVDASQAPANQLFELSLKVQDQSALQIQPAPLEVAHGVIGKRQQIGAEFCQTIYSPRYIAKYWYMEAGAARELLDPQGYRRNDSSSASYPNIIQTSADPRGRIESRPVPKFAYFIPIFINGPAGEARQLYEGGKHAHGTQSGLEHRFMEDWILVRSRTHGPGEEVAYDWSGGGSSINGLQRTIIARNAEIAAGKMPGKTIVIDAEGKAQEASGGTKGKINWPKVAAVTAIFTRPDGYDYGTAMFYPKGSRVQGNYVFQPGDKPMAFTFCTEKEFADLLKKWQTTPPPDQVDPADAGRYHGAFGASPVRGE